MNIARGYYGNHTVTGNGWATYSHKWTVGPLSFTTSYDMIAVYDGWAAGQRYIDYRAFAFDLVSAGFGSFTYIRPKS